MAISGIVGLIDLKWKWSELIWYWADCMTLPFDHTHDLDLGVEISRSESEIALSQEWDGRLTWNEKDVSHPFMTVILTSVTMVGWGMYRIVTGVTSDVGLPSTYLVFITIIYLGGIFWKYVIHNMLNPMPNWIGKFDGDALIYKMGCRPSHNPVFIQSVFSIRLSPHHTSLRTLTRIMLTWDFWDCICEIHGPF